MSDPIALQPGRYISEYASFSLVDEFPSVAVRIAGAGPERTVTGLAGSGKSTLSLALAAKTGLPVVHPDLRFWKPGWVAPSETEWREGGAPEAVPGLLG